MLPSSKEAAVGRYRRNVMIDSVPGSPPTPRSASVTGHTRAARGSHAARRLPVRPSRATVRLALLLVGNYMVVLDFTIVNVALPSIGHELVAGTSAVQWVVTGYGVAFAGLLILGAAVGAALLPTVAESASGGITGITGDRFAMATAACAALVATVVAWRARLEKSVARR